MPPKKNKNKKRGSIAVAKENGDADPLNSPVVETPLSEKQEFITPADRPENPLDTPAIINGAATATDEKPKDGDDAMIKAEGDEAAAAWGLDEEKKPIVDEPEAIPDTAEKLENGSADHHKHDIPDTAEGDHKVDEPKGDEPNGDEHKGDEHKGDEHKGDEHKGDEPKNDEPKIDGAETAPPTTEDPTAEGAGAAEPKDDIPDTKVEEPEVKNEEKPAPPADIDIPDTADAKEHIPEESNAEKVEPEVVKEEPVADKEVVEEPTADKPVDGEPAAEKVVDGEPVADKSADGEPAADKPTDGEHPATEEAKDGPPAETPAVEEPVVEAPSAEEADAKPTTEEAPAAVEEPVAAGVEEPIAAAVEEPVAETAAPVDGAPEPETKADEPEVKAEEPEAKGEEPEAVQDAPVPEPIATEGVPEGETAPEVTTQEAEVIPETTAEPAPEEPVIHKRPIMDAPKPAALSSLTSTDRDFTSTRYQSTTSPQFLNKPHQAANHSLDLDDRNMQSSVNNWYKRIYSFADSLNWRPGWEHLEEFDHLVKALEAPLSQISLAPAQDWWAEKPLDPSIEWDKIDEDGVKYEEFWEWKSKIALAAICTNFACREILGKTVFGIDEKMTKKLGLAMSVFSKDFGDDITATKFRHMTLKLLQESKSFQSSSRKQLVHLSQELSNVLSPLTSFLPVKEPQTEEEKQQQAHYTPLTLALYDKVLHATQILHDTIQKDYKYYALFHPVPGVEFDETTMEESTFQGLGAGKGRVVLVARPGLARQGLPRGGEPEDIVIVHKALVVREDALEEALRHFDGAAAAEGEAPPAPAE